MPGYGAMAPALSLSLSPAKRSGNSAEFTAGIIVADVVGAGILSTAVAVSRLGWALGAASILFMLVVNVHISLVLWRVYMMFPEARTLRELTSFAFAGATDGRRALAVGVFGGAQYAAIFLMLGLYILTLGRSLGMLFHDVHLCLPVWSAIGAAIVLPVHASGSKFGKWKALVWANCGTILATIAIPIAYMAAQGSQATRPSGSRVVPIEKDLTTSDLLSSFSTYAFGMTGQFILVEIMSEMRSAAEFPRAYVAYSAPFQCVAFLLVGVGGYYFSGGAVSGMIVESLPFGPCFRLVALLLAVHMVVTYLIKATVLCRGLHGAAFGGKPDDEGARATWVQVVALTLGLACITSQLVPFFTDLVDLVGAALIPFTCWLGPIALYMQCDGGCRWRGWNLRSVEWLVLCSYCFLATALTVCGTYESVRTIVGHWHLYGGPFGCHCEGMWSSCACSAAHAGMAAAACPAAAPALAG